MSWLRAAQYVKLLLQLGPSLFKWHLLLEASYDLVLFTDLDVDILPLRTYRSAAALTAVRREWARMLPGLLDQPGLHLVGGADWSSPINAGILLLRPSRAGGVP